MPRKILISTAYLPPTDYFSVIAAADEASVEREENYIKQSYRNRCYILSSHGRQMLSVPVYEGSLHKVPVKDVRIDYSKRWQQVHLRALVASYRSSPWFEFYYDQFEKLILENFIFLFDLNSNLMELIIDILKLNKKLAVTNNFETPSDNPDDLRYIISPKKDPVTEAREYSQVFTEKGFVAHLSIVDLIFNMGPDSEKYL